MLHSLGILKQNFVLLEAADVLTNTVQNGKQLLEDIDMVESRLDEYILATATDQADRYSKERGNSTWRRILHPPPYQASDLRRFTDVDV